MSIVSDHADADAAAAAAAAAAAGSGNQSDEEKAAAEKAAQEAAAAKAGNGDEWNKGIDESMRGKLDKFKDVNGLAKSYLELETKLGEGFKMPETDEDKAKLFAKLGRPGDAEGYELEDDDEIGFKAQAWQAGLSQDQVGSLSTWFKGIVDRQGEDMGEKRKVSEVKLREHWGDKFKDNMALANRALSADYSEDLIDRLEKGGFLDDQEFVTHLYKQGKRSADDSIGSDGRLMEINRTEAGQPFLDFPSMKEYD